MGGIAYDYINSKNSMIDSPTIIKVNNKVFTIIAKNVKAYKQMNGFIPNENSIKIYLKAYYHKNVDDIINSINIDELNDIVNKGIEQEVRECCSDKFYEEAFQERISEPTKFTVLSEEEKQELINKGILKEESQYKTIIPL